MAQRFGIAAYIVDQQAGDVHSFRIRNMLNAFERVYMHVYHPPTGLVREIKLTPMMSYALHLAELDKYGPLGKPDPKKPELKPAPSPPKKLKVAHTRNFSAGKGPR